MKYDGKEYESKRMLKFSMVGYVYRWNTLERALKYLNSRQE